MPAPAVIPAPIAYIKVVAVKKLVVEVGRGLSVCLNGVYCRPCCLLGSPESALMRARDRPGLLL